MASRSGEDSHPAYPAFLDLERRLVVIVGGGKRAEAKVRSLSKYGADLVVISPDVPDTLREMEVEELVTLVERDYVRGDLKGVFMAICVDPSEEVMAAVYLEASEVGCLVNVSAAPEMCNFRIPSQVRRGPLQIAISTAGEAPTLAKRIRRDLQERFGPEWATYVTVFGECRRLALERAQADSDAPEPDLLLEALADSDTLDRIRSGDVPDAEELLGELADRVAREIASSAEQDTSDTSGED